MNQHYMPDGRTVQAFAACHYILFQEKKHMKYKYFITDKERKGTCYHEFYRGKWDGSTFFREDSLLLHDDELSCHRDFRRALKTVIPDYDPYGETVVTKEQWQRIGEILCSKGKDSQDLYKEAYEWVREAFENCGCFTILGI